MKLKRGNYVYVQSLDFPCLARDALIGVKESVRNELFANGVRFCYVDDYREVTKFDIVFKDPENADWIMRQDWILDYDAVRILKNHEIDEMWTNLSAEADKIVQDYNGQDEEYRQKYGKRVYNELSKLSYQMEALDALINCRSKGISIITPRTPE